MHVRAKAKPPTLETLNPRKRVTVPVLENRVISNDGTNDVIYLKLGLPSPHHVLGLPAGKHFMVYAKCEVFKEQLTTRPVEQYAWSLGKKRPKWSPGRTHPSRMIIRRAQLTW